MDDQIYLLDEDVTHVSLTEAQDKALFLIPVFTGLLSAWGSANIISMFLHTDRSNRNTYKRIMLGLSCSDFLSSITLALQAFLLPSDSHRIWASGTDATCQVMGFFQQFSFSALFYNGMLSWMFLLTIKYGVTEERLASRYEAWMHILSIGWPLVTAIIGSALNMYDELSMGHYCWFTGEHTTLYAMIVSALPGFFFIIVFCPLNNLLVYCHVRHTLRRKTLPEVNFADCESAQSGDSVFSNEQIREQRLEAERQKVAQKRQDERLQSVACQSFLYVSSFMACYLPSGILRLLSGTVGLEGDEGDFFPLLLIQAMLMPLQGFFNYLIYSRSPSYLREAIN